jgi:hypothetical protein
MPILLLKNKLNRDKNDTEGIKEILEVEMYSRVFEHSASLVFCNNIFGNKKYNEKE